MSYILEALRKAESERERGLVPGLNARPLGPADSEQAPRTARLRAWMPWAIAAVSLTVAGVLAWSWRPESVDQPRPVAAAAPAAVVRDAAMPVMPAVPVYSPAPPLPAPTATTAAPQPPAATTRPPPVAGRADGATADARSPAAPVSPGVSVATAPAAAPAPPPAATGAASAAAPAEQRVYTLAELPDATRRELPALSVAGASWSERPSNRLLIVNGNVFHEGDRLAPDLVLERIDLKSAVLQFKGVRFGITY